MKSKALATKATNFEVFRYQLVVDKTLQMDMFSQYQTAEDIRADKNNIFHNICTRQKNLISFLAIRNRIKIALPK